MKPYALAQLYKAKFGTALRKLQLNFSLSGNQDDNGFLWQLYHFQKPAYHKLCLAVKQIIDVIHQLLTALN